MTSNRLLLEDDEREGLWRALVAEIESYLRDVPSLPVTPAIDARVIREWIDAADFASPVGPERAVRETARMMRAFQVQMASPRYFGLFNPAASTMSVAADALVAAFNPQLATWLRSPFAIEIERMLLRRFGERFGFAADAISGNFTTGGTEANLTAMVVALADRVPDWCERGLAGVTPRIYCSTQAHDSLRRAARICGLGSENLVRLEVDAQLRLRPAQVAAAIAADRAQGRLPVMLVGTVGTSAAGAIDPLDELATIAEREGVWFHADAAYGGFAALLPDLRPLLRGLERADSVAFDAHKMMSVSMGAGMFITRHPGVLSKAFSFSTNYMPIDRGDVIDDPYETSMQWSRRFIGLKLFLSLLVAGWDGYRDVIREQLSLAERLRERLRVDGWHILNDTPFPIVCFSAPGLDRADLVAIADAIVDGRRAWISVCLLPGGAALRASVTSHRTSARDIDELVELAREGRDERVCAPLRD